MSEIERAAFVQSQVACMLAELAAMQAVNQARTVNGEQPRFGYEDFMALPDRYLVGHNAVLSYMAGQ